jgi:hypothetical protein
MGRKIIVHPNAHTMDHNQHTEKKVYDSYHFISTWLIQDTLSSDVDKVYD